MSLNASTLATLLQSSVANLSKHTDYWPSFTKALVNYLNSNYEVPGSYVGFLPNGKPSQLNGGYIWKATFNISSSALLSAIYNVNASGDFQSKLASALTSEIKKGVLHGSCTAGVISGSSAVGCSGITFDFSSKPNTPINAHSIWASGIVTGITSSPPNPAGTGGSGVDGSTGTISFSNQI